MKKKISNVFLVITLLLTSTSIAQELKIVETSAVSISELPEYVVITSENTKILGGINITIDYKRSAYEEKLETLEELLQSGRKLRISIGIRLCRCLQCNSWNNRSRRRR